MGGKMLGSIQDLYCGISRMMMRVPRPVALGALGIVLLGVPLIVQNAYYLDLLFLIGIYMTLAIGLSILLGQAGLFSMGYAAPYAIGAYTAAIMCQRYGVSFWITIPCAILTAGLSGAVIGWPVLRVRGDYLAMVTLGFGEIVRITLNNLKFTGAADGIFGIPAPRIGPFVLTQSWQFYYLILIAVVLSWIAAKRLINSRIGRAWNCTRDDEYAAESMGVNTIWMKLLAFIVASAWAGIAGAIFIAKMTAVAPETFTFMTSFMILLGVVLGGMSNISGVVIGAAIVTLLPELFRTFEDARLLAFGIALVLLMIFRPQGLFPARDKVTTEEE
jgi:branched-chain amino acid transport system permease protein